MLRVSPLIRDPEKKKSSFRAYRRLRCFLLRTRTHSTNFRGRVRAGGGGSSGGGMKPEQLNRLMRANGRMQPWFMRSTNELYENAVKSYYERSSSSLLPYNPETRESKARQENRGPVRTLKAAERDRMSATGSCVNNYPRNHQQMVCHAMSNNSGNLLETVMQASRRRSMSFSPLSSSTVTSVGPSSYNIYGPSMMSASSSSCSSACPTDDSWTRTTTTTTRTTTVPTMPTRTKTMTTLTIAPSLARRGQQPRSSSSASASSSFNMRSLSMPPRAAIKITTTLNSGSSNGGGGGSGSGGGVGATATGTGTVIGGMPTPPGRRHHIRAVEKSSAAIGRKRTDYDSAEAEKLMVVDKALKERLAVRFDCKTEEDATAVAAPLCYRFATASTANGQRQFQLQGLPESYALRKQRALALNETREQSRFQTLGERIRQFEYIQFADGPVTSYAFNRHKDIARNLNDGASSERHAAGFSSYNALHTNHLQRRRSSANLTQRSAEQATPSSLADDHSDVDVDVDNDGAELRDPNAPPLTLAPMRAKSSATATGSGSGSGSGSATADWLREQAQAQALQQQLLRRQLLYEHRLHQHVPDEAQERRLAELNETASSLAAENRPLRLQPPPVSSRPSGAQSYAAMAAAQLKPRSHAPFEPQTLQRPQRPLPSSKSLPAQSSPSLPAAKSKKKSVKKSRKQSSLQLSQESTNGLSRSSRLSYIQGANAYVKVAAAALPLAASQPQSQSQPKPSNLRAWRQLKAQAQAQTSLPQPQPTPPSSSSQKPQKGGNHLLAASASKVLAYKRAYKTQQQMLKAEILHQQAQHMQQVAASEQPQRRYQTKTKSTLQPERLAMDSKQPIGSNNRGALGTARKYSPRSEQQQQQQQSSDGSAAKAKAKAKPAAAAAATTTEKQKKPKAAQSTQLPEKRTNKQSVQQQQSVKQQQSVQQQQSKLPAKTQQQQQQQQQQGQGQRLSTPRFVYKSPREPQQQQLAQPQPQQRQRRQFHLPAWRFH